MTVFRAKIQVTFILTNQQVFFIIGSILFLWFYFDRDYPNILIHFLSDVDIGGISVSDEQQRTVSTNWTKTTRGRPTPEFGKS